jgi:CBS domain-containing protein
MTAKDILDVKGRNIFSIKEEATVLEVINELVEKKIGLLIVKNAIDEITGVLSERDIIQKCIYHQREPAAIKVKHIMTPKDKIVMATEEDNIQSLMNTMTEKKIRHIPIFKGKTMTGIISIGDIIKNLLDLKDYEIRTLIDYISGKYPG